MYDRCMADASNWSLGKNMWQASYTKTLAFTCSNDSCFN